MLTKKRKKKTLGEKKGLKFFFKNETLRYLLYNILNSNGFLYQQKLGTLLKS